MMDFPEAMEGQAQHIRIFREAGQGTGSPSLFPRDTKE